MEFMNEMVGFMFGCIIMGVLVNMVVLIIGQDLFMVSIEKYIKLERVDR